MKKLFSVIAIAFGAVLLSSCGDDDDRFSTISPLVKTLESIENNSYAKVAGMVDWNGNTLHKELGFNAWSTEHPMPQKFFADNNNSELFSGVIIYTVKSASGQDLPWFNRGDTVYYQAVARDCIINGKYKDVFGDVKFFVVP